ncbi:MAG TPA: long-chain fatty acid--CoA ligase [Candidatus Polarisedimenticolia bacterium]|nr:long-chain fatty acid--CoA ligase [Candidatus Polarisedimenticolia bacterium]
MEVRTLCDIPVQLLAEYRKSDQILYRDGGAWRAIPTQDLCERIRSMALGFRRLGIGRGDRVALLAENRPEWSATDYAILTAGGATVPIYPTLLAEQIRFLLHDSGAKAIVVSGAEQLEKILSIRAVLPELREIFVVAPDGALPAGVRTWSDLADIGGGWSAGGAAAGQEDMGAVGPDDLASIIYTSGTTGVPKGVMLTHGNFIHNISACCAVVPFVSSDVCLSFLPLSHVYERMVEYCYFYRGATIAYAESIDTVARDLQEVRPTVACGVPRVFEKMHRRMLDASEDFPPLRRIIFKWAMAVARRHGALAGMGGGSGPFLDAQQRLADRLVYHKMRDRLGGRVRFFVTGSAPLPREIAEFFHGAGIIILEGYGLTETSPVIALNRIGSVCFGTVGKPIDGVEVRIADDGEILTRGPSVMSGYFNNEEATREVMREGWFCTGDIGRFDEHGCLVITDRKKEVLKTSGGKMIAPQPIENELRTDRFIAQAIVIGDQRRFISALLVPDFEQIRSYVERKGIEDAPMDMLLRHPKIVDLFERRIAKINERLARYERIKAFRVLNRAFSLDNGEITLTLKLRRKVIAEHYRDRIEEMYA